MYFLRALRTPLDGSVGIGNHRPFRIIEEPLGMTHFRFCSPEVEGDNSREFRYLFTLRIRVHSRHLRHQDTLASHHSHQIIVMS